MLREGIDHIDAVLLTHEHQDHIAGLDDLRPFIFRSEASMTVAASQRVLDRLTKVYDYAFTPQPYPGAPSFELIAIESDKPLTIMGIEIEPLEVLHGQLPVLGFRVGDMAYITDVNGISEEVFEKVAGVRTLFLDALHHRIHYSHYTLKQAVEVAERIGAEQTYFIHMSHYMGLHDEINDGLPIGMELAYDGLKVPFNYSVKDK
jgi:phosphoribosyl 1,2-cyclic phosphate phosphodiesterase